MSGSRLRPYLGPVIALLVVLALGAGTVYAAIPNGDGKYYACYVKNTGAVKLINYPKVKTCKAGEKLINWNAKGPAGPAGPVGATGLQGERGLQGLPGEAGITKINLVTHAVTELVVASDYEAISATCPSGKVTGGGFFGVAASTHVIDSYPYVNSWRVYVLTGAQQNDITVYAVCMTTDPSSVIASLSPAAKKAKKGSRD